DHTPPPQGGHYESSPVSSTMCQPRLASLPQFFSLHRDRYNQRRPRLDKRFSFLHHTGELGDRRWLAQAGAQSDRLRHAQLRKPETGHGTGSGRILDLSERIVRSSAKWQAGILLLRAVALSVDKYEPRRSCGIDRVTRSVTGVY